MLYSVASCLARVCVGRVRTDAVVCLVGSSARESLDKCRPPPPLYLSVLPQSTALFCFPARGVGVTWSPQAVTGDASQLVPDGSRACFDGDARVMFFLIFFY